MRASPAPLPGRVRLPAQHALIGGSSPLSTASHPRASSSEGLSCSQAASASTSPRRKLRHREDRQLAHNHTARQDLQEFKPSSSASTPGPFLHLLLVLTAGFGPGNCLGEGQPMRAGDISAGIGDMGVGGGERLLERMRGGTQAGKLVQSQQPLSSAQSCALLVITLNPQNPIMSPYHRQGDEGSERLGNLPKVTQPVRNGGPWPHWSSKSVPRPGGETPRRPAGWGQGQAEAVLHSPSQSCFQAKGSGSNILASVSCLEGRRQEGQQLQG